MADQNRNLNPHAEARLAMAMWGEEYAYKQTGGSMDFWDSRTDRQKALCVRIIDDVMKAMANKGRASDDSRSSTVDRFELGRDSRNHPAMYKSDDGDWVSYQDYQTVRGFEAMWKAHRDELLGQIEQEPYKAATDRISEYLNRVPGAYQADDGRRYWTREQVVEAVKECASPPPRHHVVGSEPRRPQPLDPRGMSLNQINAHILDLELELRRRDGTIAPENPMSFFMSSVDSWGAAEWFDRLANAIRKQDEAAVAMHRASENDKVYREADFDLYRMIAHSSAMRLVRDYEPQIRAALSAPEAEG